MRGYPQFNFPTFFKAAAKLRAEGHTVFNPAEKDVEKHGDRIWKGRKGNVDTVSKELGFSLRDALGKDLGWICAQADAVALLPGWKKSKGATAEHATAEALGLEIIHLSKEFIK